MIIKHAHIQKFRAFEDAEFDLGNNITAIVGHNGTSKTTLLGILGQPFSISNGNCMSGEKTIDGFNFRSQFSEKFVLTKKDSDTTYTWKLELNNKNNIHRKSYIELQTTTSRNNLPRFWSTEGKGSGMGYVQIPVYFLSLKRATPIGEERKLNTLPSELTDEENKFLITEYTTIFSIVKNQNLSTKHVTSQNKNNINVYEDSYDALTISAGQDILSKLLIAVLSFQTFEREIWRII